MEYPDPKAQALMFSEALGRADPEALGNLMTGDHSLLCCGSVDASGRDASLAAWRGFFEACPGYSNVMAVAVSDGAW